MELFKIIVSACLKDLPGIFYNLQKARNIECQYAACLRDEVPTGTPIAICANSRAFQWCTYVTGAYWELNPFNQIGNWLFTQIRGMLNDPVSTTLAVIAVASVLVCNFIPKAEGSSFCKVVAWANIISRVLSSINYFKNFTSNWRMEEDLCEKHEIVGDNAKSPRGAPEGGG